MVLTKRKKVELKWEIEGKKIAKTVNKLLAGDTEIFLECPSVILKKKKPKKKYNFGRKKPNSILV